MYALRAVLTQESEDGEHPIVYVSRVLTPAEKNYTTTGGLGYGVGDQEVETVFIIGV